MADLNVTDGDRERAWEWLLRPFDNHEADAESLAAEFAKVREECARVADERANAAMAVVDQIGRDLPSDKLHAEIAVTQLARHHTADQIAAAIRGQGGEKERQK